MPKQPTNKKRTARIYSDSKVWEGKAKGDALAAFRNSLHFNLVTLTNRLTSAHSRLMVKHFGVGVASQYTLSVLMQESDVMPSRLCEVTTMDKSVASRTLNSLEIKGLVSRKSDPLDQRREFWNITKAGEKFFESFIDDVIRQLDTLVQGLTTRECETLVSLLLRLQENIPLMQAYEPSAPKRTR